MRIPHIPFVQEFSKLNNHRKVYLIGLFLMSIGLPLSSVLVSSAQFLLALNWFIERDFKNKLQRLNTNKTVYLFLLLPLVHVLWLINTSDFVWALHDLKIKLPLLVIPLIIGTTKPLSTTELRWVLSTFIFAVFAGTTVSLAVLTGIYKIEITDIRGISIFISHIRFGLMIVLSIHIIGYYFITLFKNLSGNKKISLIILVLWFLTFLIILQSITGWVTLFALLLYVFIISYKNIKIQSFRIFAWAILLVIIISTFSVVSKVYYDFYFTKTHNLSELPQHTAYGNRYLNNTTSQLKENGHYINILISHKELAQTWPEISSISYKGRDAKGFPISNTAIRYLTSKGLNKDRDGLLTLEPEDIKMIENGYASCVFRKNFIPYVKIYNVVWEIDRYIKTGNANNKSIVQRIEFGRAALHIIKNNFWFGVGTGDLRTSYKQAYDEINSNLKTKNRYRAHNQFITFFVTFGFFGFLATLISMFYPGVINYSKGGILLSGFLIIIFISILNEDTFETQAGVTLYIVFYTLFSFSKNKFYD